MPAEPVKPIPGLLWRWQDGVVARLDGEHIAAGRYLTAMLDIRRISAGSPDLSDPLTALWHRAHGVPADLRQLAEEVLTPDGRREAGDDLARAVLAGEDRAEAVRSAATAILAALDGHECATLAGREYPGGFADDIYDAKAALRAALEGK